jgi:hypothetical protein
VKAGGCSVISADGKNTPLLTWRENPEQAQGKVVTITATTLFQM